MVDQMVGQPVADSPPPPTILSPQEFFSPLEEDTPLPVTVADTDPDDLEFEEEYQNYVDELVDSDEPLEGQYVSSVQDIVTLQRQIEQTTDPNERAILEQELESAETQAQASADAYKQRWKEENEEYQQLPWLGKVKYNKDKLLDLAKALPGGAVEGISQLVKGGYFTAENAAVAAKALKQKAESKLGKEGGIILDQLAKTAAPGTYSILKALAPESVDDEDAALVSGEIEAAARSNLFFWTERMVNGAKRAIERGGPTTFWAGVPEEVIDIQADAILADAARMGTIELGQENILSPTIEGERPILDPERVGPIAAATDPTNIVDLVAGVGVGTVGKQLGKRALRGGATTASPRPGVVSSVARKATGAPASWIGRHLEGYGKSSLSRNIATGTLIGSVPALMFSGAGSALSMVGGAAGALGVRAGSRIAGGILRRMGDDVLSGAPLGPVARGAAGVGSGAAAGMGSSALLTAPVLAEMETENAATILGAGLGLGGLGGGAAGIGRGIAARRAWEARNTPPPLPEVTPRTSPPEITQETAGTPPAVPDIENVRGEPLRVGPELETPPRVSFEEETAAAKRTPTLPRDFDPEGGTVRYETTDSVEVLQAKLDSIQEAIPKVDRARGGILEAAAQDIQSIINEKTGVTPEAVTPTPEMVSPEIDPRRANQPREVLPSVEPEGRSVSPETIPPSEQRVATQREFSFLEEVGRLPEPESLRNKRSRRGEEGSVIIPSWEDIRDAGARLYDGVKDFSTWSGEMVSRFGEAVKDTLRDIWDGIRGAYDRITSDETGAAGRISPLDPKLKNIEQTAPEAVKQEYGKENTTETGSQQPRVYKGTAGGKPIPSDAVAGRGSQFHAGIKRVYDEHPQGKAVTVKDLEFYQAPDTSLFMAEDGSAGVAVTPDGDLVSVFKNKDSKQPIKPLLQEASRVSKTLDAYDINGYLPTLYSELGFEPVARIKFNKNYAPEGWDYATLGEPDIVMMAKTKEPGTKVDYNTVRDTVPIVEDWDAAAALQKEAYNNSPTRLLESAGDKASSRIGTSRQGAKGKTTSSADNVDSAKVPADLLGKQMEKIDYEHLPNEVLSEKDPVKKADKYVGWMKDNLRALWDYVPKKTKELTRGWYPGANKLAGEIATKGNITIEQSSGVIAALSPQKFWDMNLAQADQVVDIYTSHRNTKIDGPEILAQIEDISEAARASTKGKRKRVKGETKEQRKARLEYNKGLEAKTIDRRRRILKSLLGKTISELKDPIKRGWAIRLLAQSIHGRTFRKVSPDGTYLGLARNDDGSPSYNTWGSISEIVKAVNILEDGSVENISNNLGKKHKVRSFYNNIVNPDGQLDVTADTHAVAAAHLMPFGASAIPVKHNFGDKIANSSAAGVDGTYHLHHRAYVELAKELGILPRELQSVVWEGIRSLFPPAERSPKAVKDAAKVWKSDTTEKARASILAKEPKKTTGE
jgi:hypothetical protein